MRDLRRDTTPAERRLRRARRADFACVGLRLVVEVDGGRHGDARDAARDAGMRAEGWCVPRFWNNEVTENLEGIPRRICEVVAERRREREAASPHPGPPP